MSRIGEISRSLEGWGGGNINSWLFCSGPQNQRKCRIKKTTIIGKELYNYILCIPCLIIITQLVYPSYIGRPDIFLASGPKLSGLNRN